MPETLSRRGVLTGAAALAAGFAAPGPARTREPSAQCFAPRLVVERRMIEVKGKAASVYGISGPDGAPGLALGPEDQFFFDLVNRSGGPTIVHWHGQTPPTNQDGVVETGYEGPIEADQSHLYDFATRPGTHFMHSHYGLAEQSLLAAPLIVRSAEDVAFDAQEVVLFLHDFSFKPPEELFATLMGKSGSPHGRASAGLCVAAPERVSSLSQGAAIVDGDLNLVDYDAFLANDRTLDDPCVVRTERRGRVRLRVINAACGTAFWLDLGGAQGLVIAADGNLVKPVSGSTFPLAQGQRLDVLLDVPPGTVLPVLARREGDRAQTGLVLAAPDAAIAKIAPFADAAAPALDLSLEERLEALMPLPVKRPNTRRLVTLGGTMTPFLWTINDRLFADHQDIRVYRGERVIMDISNASLMAHPMHLHGHVFQVITLNANPIAGAMRDTVLVPPLGSVTIAFDTDNLGRWLFHCHNLWHMTAGMMTELVYKYA